MDRFAADNPNASWREVVRQFERAMLESMREGGSLFEQFLMPVSMSTMTESSDR